MLPLLEVDPNLRTLVKDTLLSLFERRRSLGAGVVRWCRAAPTVGAWGRDVSSEGARREETSRAVRRGEGARCRSLLDPPPSLPLTWTANTLLPCLWYRSAASLLVRGETVAVGADGSGCPSVRGLLAPPALLDSGDAAVGPLRRVHASPPPLSASPSPLSASTGARDWRRLGGTTWMSGASQAAAGGGTGVARAHARPEDPPATVGDPSHCPAPAKPGLEDPPATVGDA